MYFVKKSNKATLTVGFLLNHVSWLYLSNVTVSIWNSLRMLIELYYFPKKVSNVKLMLLIGYYCKFYWKLNWRLFAT